ncbi:MAG: hypothetical protein ACQCN3_02520 [Candidatus Bathyarchaeia archaeon]
MKACLDPKTIKHESGRHQPRRRKLTSHTRKTRRCLQALDATIEKRKKKFS